MIDDTTSYTGYSYTLHTSRL